VAIGFVLRILYCVAAGTMVADLHQNRGIGSTVEGIAMEPSDRKQAGLEGLIDVRRRIEETERHAGRPAGSVRLIVVSKTFGSEATQPIIDAGQRDFGENRVQEAQAKWPDLRSGYRDIRLHLIGPLQSNKAAEAVALFDAIHTIDRDKIASAVAAEMRKQGRQLRLLVQVNTGEEPQKAGIAPTEAADFVARCRDVHGLAVDGLMCIPPADQVAAPHFALLAKLAERLGLATLSMGMSGDFETAIAMGATDVRVGSAIFGSRA
jgi:pyridoxal phosphate enzyme (YggS family)